MFKPGLLLSVVLLATSAFCKLRTTEEWVRGNRRIYQILTDRFDVGSGQYKNCELTKYCGGDWNGIRKQLPYIRDLGFNAIWISSHLKQIDYNPSEKYQPYHGYHIKDYYQLNEHFGTEEDLRALLKEAHDMDIWVMVDVVYNHMGPVDYSQPNPYKDMSPFNKVEYYHDCNGCPADCNIVHWEDFTDFGEMEHCRLQGLPDLNQSNEFVSQELIKWAVHTVNTYDFDGFRIDTVAEVHPEWAAKWHRAIGNGYTIGELFNGNITNHYNFVRRGHYPGLFSYPLFFKIQDSVMRGNSLVALRDSFEEQRKGFAKIEGPSYTNFAPHHAMSPFSSNHDNGRLLSIYDDRHRAVNAIVFTMTIDGVPTLYYGEEQFFTGGYDPANREPMWKSGFSKTTEGFHIVQKTNAVRDLYPESFTPENPVEFLHTDDRLMVYRRGKVLVAITNAGYGVDSLERAVDVSSMWKPGTNVCNVFWADRKDGKWSGDCVQVGASGKLKITLLRGEPKLFVEA